jgi:hypothetical protein
MVTMSQFALRAKRPQGTNQRTLLPVLGMVCSGRRSPPGHQDLREGSASEALLLDDVKLQVLI